MGVCGAAGSIGSAMRSTGLGALRSDALRLWRGFLVGVWGAGDCSRTCELAETGALRLRLWTVSAGDTGLHAAVVVVVVVDIVVTAPVSIVAIKRLLALVIRNAMISDEARNKL